MGTNRNALLVQVPKPCVPASTVGASSVKPTEGYQSKNAAIASATSWFVGVGQSRTTFGSASIVMSE